jgi:hypothetical protein
MEYYKAKNKRPGTVSLVLSFASYNPFFMQKWKGFDNKGATKM